MSSSPTYSAPRRLFHKFFRAEWLNEVEFLDGYLRNVPGLIHVGANHGQEREFYQRFDLAVIWVEAIPEVYDRLRENIAGYPKQRAIQALLTDRVGESLEFKVANNGGASSSLFEFDAHAKLWPEIQYEKTIELKSMTLQALMTREALSPSDYPALTMDVEGAELLVLKGAGPLLRQFRYVKAEVADFTPRTGSPVTADLVAFMAAAGFEELMRRPFAQGPGGVGTYWDIVWKKKARVPLLQRPRTARLPLIASDVSGVGWDKLGD
jgi:FkbM family methyltransferase